MLPHPAASRRLSARLKLALLPVLLLVALAIPAPVGAMRLESYSMTGYEVFYAPTRAIFVGAGNGEAGPLQLSGWYTSVDHTLSVSPGFVTGGFASLRRIDGVQIQGTFTDGTVAQTNPGPDCTTETHVVKSMLRNVSRSDSPGLIGSAYLEATLTHYRSWIFGECYSYSAKVEGTITVAV
jgi:hypothetical protein